MNPPIFLHSRQLALTIDSSPVTVLAVFNEDQTLVREWLEREIAARSGLASDEVKIVSLPRVPPRVEIGGRASAEWHVSLSHTHRCSLGALSFGQTVGVDAEWIDPAFKWEPVAAEFFPLDVAKTWKGQPADEARREFFQYWARWEAALKCRGTGFGPAPESPAAAAFGLDLFDLDLGPGYAGCLAGRSEAFRDSH